MNENRMAPICIVVFGWWLCFRSKWGHTQVGEAARRDLVRALHAVERSQRLGNAGRRIEQTPGREWHPLSKVQLPVCAEPRGMHALYVHPVQIRVLQWVWPALPHGSSLRCRSFLRQTGSALSPPSQLPFLPSWQGTPRSPAPLTGNLLFIGSYPLSSQHFISKKKKINMYRSMRSNLRRNQPKRHPTARSVSFNCRRTRRLDWWMTSAAMTLNLDWPVFAGTNLSLTYSFGPISLSII